MKTSRLTYCDICGAAGHSEKACPLYRLNEMQTTGASHSQIEAAYQRLSQVASPMRAKTACLALFLLIGLRAQAQLLPGTVMYHEAEWKIRMVDHGKSPLPGEHKCKPKTDEECYLGLTDCKSHQIFLLKSLNGPELKFTLWHELEHVITDCAVIDEYRDEAPAGRLETDIDTLFNDMAAGFGELFSRNEALVVFFFGERQAVTHWGQR